MRRGMVAFRRRLAVMYVSASIVTIATFVGLSAGVTAVAQTRDVSLVAIELRPNNATLEPGEKRQVVATGTFDNDSTQRLTADIDWKSSDVAVVDVDGTGLVTARGVGSATVTGSRGDVGGRLDIKVIRPESTLEVIQVTPRLTLLAEEEGQLTATGRYSNGTEKDITRTVTWSAGDSKIAIVNDVGLVTAKMVGSVIIQAAQGNVTDAATVNVVARPVVLVQVTITPESLTLAPRQAREMSATGTYSDGTSKNITDDVTWSAPESEVAAIDAAGLVTARQRGSLTIQASLGGVTGITTVTVAAAPRSLVDLTVAPPALTLRKGERAPMKATATYSDGTKEAVTTDVEWSSENPKVASVLEDGVVRATGEGETTVIASLGELSDNARVTVDDLDVVD